MKKVFWAHDYLITPLGFGIEENLCQIEKYQANLSLWDDQIPVCRIDEARFDAIDPLGAFQKYTPAERIALYSLAQVIAESGVDVCSPKTTIILSTTKGNIDSLPSNIDKAHLSAMAQTIVDHFQLPYLPLVISNACISGVSAIVVASRLITAGTYDHILVVGVDRIGSFIVSGFNAFKSLSPKMCRPYDASRDGLTLGEGCGAVLLTSDRTLSPHGIVVAGGAITNDANHISGPSRTGDGLYYAMRDALDQSGVLPHELGFVNTHGTATLFNDEMESKALQWAQLTATPCNSLKCYFGHTLGASGVIESILSVHQLCADIVFGVKGYHENGVPFGLNIQDKHRSFPLHSCLKTASGFGGCNAAVVFVKEQYYNTKEQHPVVEAKESARVLINQDPSLSFHDFIRQEYRLLEDPNMKFFKMDDLCKLGYIAVAKLLKNRQFNCSSEKLAIILSNKSGSLDTDIKHQALLDAPDAEVSPAVFVYTLPNIVAGEVAIKNKLKGETTFFVEPNKNVNFVESYARLLLAQGAAQAVIYGWCELLGEEYNAELVILERK